MTKGDLRSTECIPAILFDQSRTSKVNKQTSASWAENHVLVLDVPVYWDQENS